MRYLIGATLFLALAPAAGAREIPEVRRFLQEEIVKLQKVEEPGVDGNGTYAPLGEYRLSLFRLRLKAEFGFDVGLARVSVEPIAEFFWE